MCSFSVDLDRLLAPEWLVYLNSSSLFASKLPRSQRRTFEIRSHVESVGSDCKAGYAITGRTCESCSITIGGIYSQDVWRDGVYGLSISELSPITERDERY